MSRPPKDYSRVFDVFKDRPLSKLQKIFILLGGLAFTVYFVAQIAFKFLVEGKYDGVAIPPLYHQLIVIPAAWGFFVGFLMLALAAVEYVGHSFGKTGFWTSLWLVVRKVFTYVVVPAIIITVLLLPIIIYNSGQQ